MEDIAGVKDLIMWARKNGVSLASARVGVVEVCINSMQPSQPLPTEREAAAGLIRQFGGEALEAELEREMGHDNTVPDDED